jgi:hypothetical protein
MSERDDRYVGNDTGHAGRPDQPGVSGQQGLPSTTAEFRAAPDASASTAEFKAFAAGQTAGTRQPSGSVGSWPEQPWPGQVPSGGSGRTVALVIGAIVVLAIIITLVVLLA